MLKELKKRVTRAKASHLDYLVCKAIGSAVAGKGFAGIFGYDPKSVVQRDEIERKIFRMLKLLEITLRFYPEEAYAAFRKRHGSKVRLPDICKQKSEESIITQLDSNFFLFAELLRDCEEKAGRNYENAFINTVYLYTKLLKRKETVILVKEDASFSEADAVFRGLSFFYWQDEVRSLALEHFAKYEVKLLAYRKEYRCLKEQGKIAQAKALKRPRYEKNPYAGIQLCRERDGREPRIALANGELISGLNKNADIFSNYGLSNIEKKLYYVPLVVKYSVMGVI